MHFGPLLFIALATFFFQIFAMDEDDKHRGLCQLLKERCQGPKFTNDDFKTLVDAGYDTKVHL